MLEIHTIEGVSRPVWVCAMCGDRLHEVLKAAVVFSASLPEGGKTRALHVHKNLDGKTCHEEAEALVGLGGHEAGWQEMSEYLCHLSMSTDFTPANMTAHTQAHSDLSVQPESSAPEHSPALAGASKSQMPKGQLDS